MTIPLNAKAILDSTEFQQGVDKMRSSGTGASKDIAGAFSALGLSSIASFATITGAIAGTVKILGDCASEAADDETIMTRLGVTLEDMGRSANISAPGLEKTAMNLQMISGINHDDILQAYNAIARFENLDTSAMDRIVKDAIDMFAGGEGGSVAENANMVARVLETGVIPRTWGFSFALKAAIQDEVKAGDTTKALADTLGTLEQRFGGQAAAAIGTTAGQYKLLTADIKTMEEEIGQKLLPTEKAIIQVFDLAITAHDKMDTAIKEHAVNVIKETHSYAEYEHEMIRAKLVEEGFNIALADGEATKKMEEFDIDILTKRYGFLTEAEEAMVKATYAVGYQSTATKEALEQQMPVLDDTKTATEKLDKAVVDYAGDLADALGVVKDNTQYTKDLADAEKKLADDIAKGWKPYSQVIKDDEQAIKDLKDEHHKAMLQMQVDLLQYGLTLDGTFDASDQQRILDYELKLGLLTQGEYDEATAILKRKDALDKLPQDWSATYKTYWMTYYLTYGEAPGSSEPISHSQPGTTGGNRKRSDFPPGAQGDAEYARYVSQYGAQAGTPGWMTVPPGYPNDTYLMALTSDEKVNVVTAGANENPTGGGMTLNNYGTVVVQAHEDVQESILAQLR